MVEMVVSSTLQSCTDLIGDQFSLLYNYKTNFENLRAQLEKLTLVRQRVQHKILGAERIGKRVERGLMVWLNKANKLIDEANTMMEDEWKGEDRCFWGLCPNLEARHQLSKKAVRKVKAMALLLSRPEIFQEVPSHNIPDEISSLISSSQNPFISLRNYKRYCCNLETEIEKLMDARERMQHRMEVARRNGEAIYEDVLKWVTRVEDLVDDTRRNFEVFDQKATTRSFIGLCPDLRIRYHLSNKAVRQLKAVAELRGEGVFDRVSYTIIPPNIWLTSTKVYETFGSRTSTLEDLYNALKDDNVNMIGVYGMGGIGKTVLVKQVAARVETDKLFDVVIFAEITPYQDIRKIQGDIADQVGLMFREENEAGRAIRLLNRLKKEKNVLLILDNIWTGLDLYKLGIPIEDSQTVCKVLLTSRNHDVLVTMHSQKNFSVGVLDEEEAFSLFKKIAGDSTESRELQFLALDIAKLCGGLPIAIASIAIALKGKGLSTWRNALRSLGRPLLNNFSGVLAEVYSSIELSYNHLNSEELKSTFLLCALLKYSGDLSIMDLLKYGMGLGLLNDVFTLQEARFKVSALVHVLKSSCLLLDCNSSDWFTLNDVVHLVAISIASRFHHALTLRNEAIDWL